MSQVQGTTSDNLQAEISPFIANTRQRLAGAVNAELTHLYWTVADRLRTEEVDGTDQYGN